MSSHTAGTFTLIFFVGCFCFAIVLSFLFVLKWIPNDKIQAAIGGLGELCGRTMTLNLAKWKWSAPYWNTIVEPYIIDLVDNTVVTFITRWKQAMRSDNPSS